MKDTASEVVADRLVEWALREELGGEAPPDLREQVRLHVRAGEVPALAPEEEPARGSWTSTLWIAAGGAVAGATAWRARGDGQVGKSAAPQDAESRAALPAPWTTVTAAAELAKLDRGCRALRVQAAGAPFVAELARLPRLERLDLTRTSSEGDVLDEKDLHALGALTTLRELRLDLRIEIEPAWLGALSGLPVLETLALAHVQVGDDGVAALAKLPSLKRLEIAFDWTLSDRGAAYLATIAGLRELRLRGCGGITPAGLRELGKLTALECLDLSLTNGVSPGGQAQRFVLGRGAAMLETEMIFAGKPGAGVTDDVLGELAKLVKLRELRLGGCASVTVRGVAALGALPLRVLELYCPNGGVVDIVRALPRTLQELSLAWSRGVDEAALVELGKRFPNLRRLDLSQCSGVADAGLRAVLDACRLEVLSLRGCRGPTAASLDLLFVETTLTSLDVSGLSWVTPEVEAKLRALPALRQLECKKGGLLPPR